MAFHAVLAFDRALDRIGVEGDIEVLRLDPGLIQRQLRRFPAEIGRGLVGMDAELGHADADDEGFSHRISPFTYAAPARRLKRGCYSCRGGWS